MQAQAFSKQSANATKQHRIRRSRVKPMSDVLYGKLVAQRKLMLEGSAIAKAIGYSLSRYEASTRYADDGHVSVDDS